MSLARKKAEQATYKRRKARRKSVSYI